VFALGSDAITIFAQEETRNESVDQIEQRVENLVRQLGDSEFAKRKAAERNLVQLGPKILQHLSPPETAGTPAIREAIRRLREELERQAARESLNPGRVTLPASHKLTDIVSELTKQTRNRVIADTQILTTSNTELPEAWKEKPFWECVDDVCHHWKLNYEFDERNRSIRLVPVTTANKLPMSVSYSGPVRIAIVQSKVQPIVGDSKKRLLRISGNLDIEPRLRPLLLSFRANDLHATLEPEFKLAPWNEEARYEQPVSDTNPSISFQFDFVIPFSTDKDQEALRHFTLQARVILQIAASTERIVFDKRSLVAGTSRRRGGVTVRVLDVANQSSTDHDSDQDENSITSIKVAVAYDTGGPAFESHRTWILHNSAYLESNSGPRLPFTDSDTNLQTDGAVSVTYRWKKLSAKMRDASFVYEAPTLIMDVPVEWKSQLSLTNFLNPQSEKSQ